MLTTNTALVVGGDGTLGRELCRRLAIDDRIQLWRTTREHAAAGERRIVLDLASDPHTWPDWPRADAAYLCAAVTSQQACQNDPQGTALINVHHTLELAERLMNQGTFVVFVSTNLVYDGSVPFTSQDLPVTPQTEYGRQKAAVERELPARGEYAAVVRLGKVLPSGYPLFATWKQQLLAGQAIHPFADACISPLPIGFVGELLLRVGGERRPGLIQATGNRDVSYAEIAARLAARIGADPELVQPQRVADRHPELLPLPRHATLATSAELSRWGLTIPDVWATIDAAC